MVFTHKMSPDENTAYNERAGEGAQATFEMQRAAAEQPRVRSDLQRDGVRLRPRHVRAAARRPRRTSAAGRSAGPAALPSLPRARGVAWPAARRVRRPATSAARGWRAVGTAARGLRLRHLRRSGTNVGGTLLLLVLFRFFPPH